MVVVHVLGLGVVVVLGPFLDRMTASQFCAGSTWSPYCASGGFPITVAAATSSRNAREIDPAMLSGTLLITSGYNLCHICSTNNCIKVTLFEQLLQLAWAVAPMMSVAACAPL